jgi:hypothetical protein
MTSIPGVDYAWSHPGGKALAAAGKKFAARYLSTDADKNITRTEADDLAAHGVSSVVVWESTAKRPLSGRAAGISDAKTATAQAAAAGIPPGRPVYFAVDFDATARQMPTVMAYLDGAASVLGTARTGVYGGYDTVKAAFDGGHARWAWQTRAWSEGHWDPRAHIRQGATQTIGGVSCDLNSAYVADYGQWMPGVGPPLTTQEDELSWSSVLKIKKGPWFDKDQQADAAAWLMGANGKAEKAAVNSATVLTEVRALAGKVGTASLTDAQLDQLAAKVAASPVLAAAIAKAVVDIEAKRLDS